MADKIIMRPIEALTLYASNPRIHPPEQIKKIARSIERFGFTNPLLVDNEGVIVAGHGRWLGARELGLSEVPTIDIDYLTEEEIKAYRIADNELTLQGAWDTEMLGLELRDLKELGFDLELTGFDELELQSLVNGLGDGGDAPSNTLAESWAVIVECENEAEQIELIQRLQGEGRKVRGSIA